MRLRLPVVRRIPESERPSNGNRAFWVNVGQIVKGRRFYVGAVAPIYDYRVGQAGAEAAFVPDTADEFDKAGPFVERDLGAADEELRVAVDGRDIGRAVLVHSPTISAELVVGNPNFHDMAWFTRNSLTFSKWRGLHDVANFRDMTWFS